MFSDERLEEKAPKQLHEALLHISRHPIQQFSTGFRGSTAEAAANAAAQLGLNRPPPPPAPAGRIISPEQSRMRGSM